jgi:hypothetical protein
MKKALVTPHIDMMSHQAGNSHQDMAMQVRMVLPTTYHIIYMYSKLWLAYR